MFIKTENSITYLEDSNFKVMPQKEGIDVYDLNTGEIHRIIREKGTNYVDFVYKVRRALEEHGIQMPDELLSTLIMSYEMVSMDEHVINILHGFQMCDNLKKKESLKIVLSKMSELTVHELEVLLSKLPMSLNNEKIKDVHESIAYILDEK